MVYRGAPGQNGLPLSAAGLSTVSCIRENDRGYGGRSAVTVTGLLAYRVQVNRVIDLSSNKFLYPNMPEPRS